MNIFKLDKEGITLSAPEVLLHSEFAKLWKRDKSDDKAVVLNEFKFIYAICDYKSVPNRTGLDEKETLIYAIKLAGFDKNYLPDDSILDAMDLYKGLNTTILRETNTELLKAFRVSFKIIKVLRNGIELALENLGKRADFNSEDYATSAASLIAKQKALTDLGKEIPKTIEALSLSLKQVKEEEDKAEGKIGRGNRVILDSQDPNKTLVPRN